MTDWAAGVVLIFVAAGDPKDALAHQGLYGVLHEAAPPLGHAGGQRGAEPHLVLGFASQSGARPHG